MHHHCSYLYRAELKRRALAVLGLASRVAYASCRHPQDHFRFQPIETRLNGADRIERPLRDGWNPPLRTPRRARRRSIPESAGDHAARIFRIIRIIDHSRLP